MTSDSNIDRDLTALLRDRLDYFQDMFAAGKIGELVDDFYTDDAVVEGTGMPPIVGKAAIAEGFIAARKVYESITIEMEPIRYSCADLAYGCITNANKRVEGETEIHRAAIVWRRIGGKWRCQVDFFYIREGS